MADHKLKAEKRKLTGRKVKQLRREGILPANIYGKKVKSLAVQVENDEFNKVFEEAGETSIVNLMVSKSKHPVLIHNVQFDPVTDEVIHADFYEVDLKQKVTAEIPVELVGESPADKQGLGTLVQQVSEIEVEALPTDLLDRFEVDVSGLSEVDAMVKVADLKYDKKKIEVQEDSEQIIAKIEALRAEEEEPVVVAEVEEGEAVEGEVKEGEEKAPEAGKEEEKPSEASGPEGQRPRGKAPEEKK